MLVPSPVSSAVRSRRREALSELRRAEILSAAIKVFGQKGFQATRAEDIAVAAGIAKGTLYLYFDSKESIYTAALARALEALQVEIEHRSSQANSFAERLAAVIHIRLEFWLEHKAIYRLLLTVGREARHRRQTNEVLRNAQASFMTIFAAGVGSGEIAAMDFSPLAWATLDMLRGANERRMDRVCNISPDVDAQWITACVLRQIVFLHA